MNIPQFTAQASLYRTSNSYRSSVDKFGGSIQAQSVVAALTYDDTVKCSACENKCNEQGADCVAVAVVTWGLGLAGCAAFGPFAPACAIPVTIAYGLAIGVCTAKLGACRTICNLPGEACCPVFCELGHCCSEGETCIPHGCCPGGQAVCGGNCCNVGETCCGSTCCPSHYYCIDGNFCSQYPSAIPFGNPPPPPPPPDNGCMLFGGVQCGSKCCYGGLQCCGVFNGQPDCRTSCLR